jgi:hypothetical protein
MDQELQTLKKDILTLRNSFLSERKTFDVIRLVPYVYDSGKLDYILTLKADWLTEKVNNEGLWEALTSITHRLYELRDQGKVTNKTLQLVNGVDILTDCNLSEAEWNKLHAIDLLAESEANKPIRTLQSKTSWDIDQILFPKALPKFETGTSIEVKYYLPQDKAHQH